MIKSEGLLENVRFSSRMARFRSVLWRRGVKEYCVVDRCVKEDVMDFKSLLEKEEYAFLRENKHLGDRIMLLGLG